MNQDQVNGVIRHTLTAAGGAGLVTSQETLLQLVSALATIIGIVWSFIEKRKAGGGPPAYPPPAGGAVAALGLLLGGSLLVGCGTVAPGSDAVVVRAEQTIEAAFEVVDSFLLWEHQTPDAPVEVKRAANELRVGFPASHRAAVALVKTYKTSKTPENKADLETILEVLRSAQREASKILSLYSVTKHETTE